MLRSGQGNKSQNFKLAMEQAKKMQQYCELKVSELAASYSYIVKIVNGNSQQYMIFLWWKYLLSKRLKLDLLNVLYNYYRLNVAEKTYSNILEKPSTEVCAKMDPVLAIIVLKLPHEGILYKFYTDLEVGYCSWKS